MFAKLLLGCTEGIHGGEKGGRITENAAKLLTNRYFLSCEDNVT